MLSQLNTEDFNIFRQLLDEFISPEAFDTPEEYRLYATNFLNTIESSNFVNLFISRFKLKFCL